jgi:hypothetical protein
VSTVNLTPPARYIIIIKMKPFGIPLSHCWGKSGQDVDKHIFTGEMIVMELLKWYTSIVTVTGRPFNARASKRPVVPPPLVGRYAERVCRR